MDCLECQSLLNDALDETLSEAQHSAFHQHIQGCADCRGRVEGELALQDVAKNLLVDPPEILLAEVMHRISGEKKPRRFIFGRFTTIAAMAAALLLIIYVGENQGWFGSGTSSSDSAMQSAAPEISLYSISPIMGGADVAPEDAPIVERATLDVPLPAGNGEVYALPETGGTEVPDFKSYGAAVLPEISIVEQYIQALSMSNSEEISRLLTAEALASHPPLEDTVTIAAAPLSIDLVSADEVVVTFEEDVQYLTGTVTFQVIEQDGIYLISGIQIEE